MTVAESLVALLIPMHADNWALSLASGYLGGGLRSDAARDAQSLTGGGILAFLSKEVPSWAIAYGDEGPRVVLRLHFPPIAPVGSAEEVVIDNLIRVTRIEAAIFANETERANFLASYSPFPDVPTTLVESLAGPLPLNEGAVEIQVVPAICSAKGSTRQELDYLGGWAAGLFDTLSEGSYDSAIQRHLAKPGKAVRSIAASLLDAVHASASDLDRAIWGVLIETLSQKAAVRGYDKVEVLEEVGQKLKAELGVSEGVDVWLSTCLKVVKAQIEPPPLGDDRRIGQRAALAALLSPEVNSAASLSDLMGAGPIVQTLVRVAARAFEGLARYDARHKNEKARYDALLTIAEALLVGAPTQLSFSQRTLIDALNSQDSVLVNNELAFVRGLSPQPHEVLLQARIAEAGFKLRIDPDRESLFFSSPASKLTKIFVGNDPASTPANPVVRLFIPLGTVSARSGKQFETYLSAAWTTGCSVGLVDFNGTREACAFATQPTATLDRDELMFHVGRLLNFIGAVGQKKKPAARSRRAKELPTRT